MPDSFFTRARPLTVNPRLVGEQVNFSRALQIGIKSCKNAAHRRKSQHKSRAHQKMLALRRAIPRIDIRKPTSHRAALAASASYRERAAMNRRSRAGKPDRDHEGWLSALSVSGPFLALPVLSRVWPTLDPIDQSWWRTIRLAQADSDSDPEHWIEFLLRRLCGWGDNLHRDGLSRFRVPVTEHETFIEPDFALIDHVTGAPLLFGMITKPGRHPTARISGDPWAATPADRMARLCRHWRVPLALVTDGRWIALVAAPPQAVTSTAVFDTATWPETAERVVIRAFVSLLGRRRFFGVPEGDTLPALLRESLDRQVEVTGALGDQVRRAVEMLVNAIGWHDAQTGMRHHSVPAEEVYSASLAMVMRVVFLLYAEERALLPSDNELYVEAYSVRQLGDDLERESQETSEHDLEHSCAAWLRLLALCQAIHQGVSHERLTMPTYDGPMFDPDRYPWLPEVRIDDRTVLHMLQAVRYVRLGRERRRLSFRALGVEQIGYVYEQLLAFSARRTVEVTVGLGLTRNAGPITATLTELEEIAPKSLTPAAQAAALLERYTKGTKGGVAALAKRLEPLLPADAAEAQLQLYAVCGGDLDLVERLLRFSGVIRRDLRDLPLVFLPGAIHMTAAGTRASTGSHYTPPELADEVARSALEELVYYPGPAQTRDRSAWRVRSAEELLSLRIADIAVGSGAFLVAACRFLAARLVEAWTLKGEQQAEQLVEATARDRPPDDVEADPLTIKARRAVIQHCLYGVDINPTAVEIAKLCLWLISLDPTKPFTFLDHQLVSGDALLGITSIEQLEALHLDPAAGRALQDRLIGDPARGVRELVARTADARRALAQRADDHLADVQDKSEQWRIVREWLATELLIADLITGAALNNAGRPGRGLRDDSKTVVDLCRRLIARQPGAIREARAYARRWLGVDQPADAPARTPLHWPLVFADVFENGGFDAIVGNQPYLGGQKITGVLGRRYREHLVQRLGGGLRGSADLVAYFVVRSHELLNKGGVAGLIATNTLAQGDSREVGLSNLLTRGETIRRATKSRRWPTKAAALEVCLITTSRQPTSPDALCELDGTAVRGITASLDPTSRVSGKARRLSANAGTSFQGSTILGLGFTVEPDGAAALIRKNVRNKDVLFPYLNGKDLNSRSDCSASRWVINFQDWSIERAQSYPECYERILRLVKPERDKNSRTVYRDYWWQYAEKRPALYRAIAGLERVIVITLVSKTVMPVMVPTGQVFSHMLGVFATDDTGMLALLSSAPHYWWAVSRASTLETRLRYTPSDVFETLPLPEVTDDMRSLGDRLDRRRREIMLARQAGLTDTYNPAFDPHCRDDDIAELRQIHKDIDVAVCAAYGWTDLIDQGLKHGFHKSGPYIRYTVGPAVQREIVDRLLELNQARYAEQSQAKDARRPRQLSLDDGT